MFNVSFVSINGSTQSAGDSDFNNCSFAALLDRDLNNLNVNRSTSLLNVLNRTLRTSTVTLDWAIGNTSCQNPSTTECGRNSNCLNSTTTGSGYRCRCRGGYDGNPYLGCEDIDECKLHKYPKGAQCVNSEGGYGCSCPSGYFINDKFTNGTEACLPGNNKSTSRKEVVFLGIGLAVGILVVLAVGFWLFKKLRKRKQIKLKEKYFKKNGGLLLEQQVSSGQGTVEKTKIFVQEELEKATDNFNKSRILGKGGSGTVYKGMLTDGRIVAIKKSKIVNENQTGDFINELVILSQIIHRHVVKLLGCCLETEVPLLVYEYISNGTLSQHLHDSTLKLSISWECRLRISKEIAGALSYLHSSASTPIFHRDIKSSNILLDERYKATVSDFGISRSVPIEATHLTTLVQGTFGYLDPEYFHSGQFTDKSDVYSFGIVLVELLTGQKPISFSRSEQETNLAMHFISSVKQDRLHEILETCVLNEAGKEEIFVVAKLAKRCLKLVGKKRPNMKEVMVELEGLRRHDQEQPLIQKNYQPSMNLLVDEQSRLTI